MSDKLGLQKISSAIIKISQIEETLKKKYANQNVTEEQLKASAIEELEKTSLDYKNYCIARHWRRDHCYKHFCGLPAEIASNVNRRI